MTTTVLAPITTIHDLPEIPANYQISVKPQVLSIMFREDEQGGTYPEREAITKIMKVAKLCDGGVYWFSIPHCYGQTAPERKFTERTFAAQVEFKARSIELILKISKELELEPEAVGTMLQSDAAALLNDPKFAVYVPELLALAEDQDSISHIDCVATAYLRRALSGGWTIENTLALHSNILNQVYQFCEIENSLAEGLELDEGKL